MLRFRFAMPAVVFATAIGLLTEVYAADLYTKAPIAKQPATLVAPVYDWTGWYVGAAAGYGSGNVTLGSPTFAGASVLDPSGFVGLLQAGYDYQFYNNVVVGARLMVPILSFDDSAPAFGTTIEAKVKRAIIFAGRLGYAYGDFLPYLIGGFVWGRGEGTVVGVGSPEADHTGYLIGLGLEYRLTPHWTIDANFTHVRVDEEGYDFTPFGGIVAYYGFRSNSFLIGANYRF